MKDKRSIDDISLDELEHIVAIRRRQQRQDRLRRYETEGRRIVLSTNDMPHQHEAAENITPIEPPITYDITDDLPHFEDEEDAHSRKPKTTPSPAQPRGSRYRPTWDKTLLAIEVFGITGFIIVAMFAAYYLINENRRLNDKMDTIKRESAQVQEGFAALVATSTPAPELGVRLSDYVLPSGHTYNNNGEGMFNFDELPESVRPAALAQQIAAPQSALTYTQVDTSPAQIAVETDDVSINNASIWEGDDWTTLQKGVGHLPYTANPGEIGNMVLTGHNDIYGEVFRDIGNLGPGDEIRVMNRAGQWYIYEVTEWRIVNPSQTEVLLPRGGATLTLITCYPYQVDTQRLVIFADLRN
jgi:sortase A